MDEFKDDLKNSDENSGISINGFYYPDSEQGEFARREENAVQYLREQCNNAKGPQILQLYNKLINANLFKTENGIIFLYELRMRLLNESDVDPALIPDIPVLKSMGEKEQNIDALNTDKRHLQNAIINKNFQIRRLKGSVIIAGIFSVICVIMIIFMFVILEKSDSPNILNYEEAIVNKYSEWEMELKEREDEVRKKEIELHIQP